MAELPTDKLLTEWTEEEMEQAAIPTLDDIFEMRKRWDAAVPNDLVGLIDATPEEPDGLSE